MKKLVRPVLALFCLILISCQQEELDDKVLNLKENNEIILHPKLVGVGSQYADEPGGYRKSKFEERADIGVVRISNYQEYLIATTWYVVNACGECRGNISFQNDTILLTYTETSEVLCKSQIIEKVTYFIDNSDKKKWTIIQQKQK